MIASQEKIMSTRGEGVWNQLLLLLAILTREEVAWILRLLRQKTSQESNQAFESWAAVDNV
jgi:hypothetical protein